MEPCVVAHIVLHMVSSLGYRNDARPSGRALKIMKELRYIKELKERLKRGEKLESLQRPKVARESVLRCELRDLLEEKSFTSEVTYTTTIKGVLHKVKLYADEETKRVERHHARTERTVRWLDDAARLEAAKVAAEAEAARVKAAAAAKAEREAARLKAEAKEEAARLKAKKEKEAAELKAAEEEAARRQQAFEDETVLILSNASMSEMELLRDSEMLKQAKEVRMAREEFMEQQEIQAEGEAFIMEMELHTAYLDAADEMEAECALEQEQSKRQEAQLQQQAAEKKLAVRRRRRQRRASHRAAAKKVPT